MSSMDEGFAFYYYLKSKYPDDYLKFTDDKVSEDVKNSIISKHAREFDIWKEVPYDVLLHWNGNPPEEIMVAASQGNYRKLQLDPYYIKESEDTYSTSYESFAPEPEQIMATVAFATAIERGYSQQASLALAQESMFRELLADKARTNTMTAEEKEIWRKSREKTRDIIRKDWASQTILSNIKLSEEQSQAIQSHIAGRNISRAKREMLNHTPDNLTSKQRINNIPSSLVNERTI